LFVEQLEDRRVLTAIGPGFDLFVTEPGTSVDLTGVGLGVVPLEGVPLPGFTTTDTIVERIQGSGSPFDPPGDSVKIDIELVALHLQSVSPVDLTPLGGPFVGVFADLHTTINEGNIIPGLPQPDAIAPSIGEMEIRHDLGPGAGDDFGGTFDSCFGTSGEAGHPGCTSIGVAGGGVFADAIFTLPGGDPANPLDVLHSAAAPPIKLSSDGGTWLHVPPPGNARPPSFPAGDFYVVTIPHVGPHPVKPADGEEAATIVDLDGSNNLRIRDIQNKPDQLHIFETPTEIVIQDPSNELATLVGNNNGLNEVRVNKGLIGGGIFVQTIGGNDILNVTPSATIAIDVDGGDPTTAPGDVLNYVGAGTNNVTGPGEGTITGPGVLDVDYANIEDVRIVALGAGFDLFHTPAGSSHSDFDPDGLAGLPPVRIEWEGRPIGELLGPARSDTDTIVQRLDGGVPWELGQPATVPIELVALSLQSVDPVDIGGTLFDATVIGGSLLGQAPSPHGQMQIFREDENGGLYDAVLPVQAIITLTEVGNPTNQIQTPFLDNFIVEDAPWSRIPGPGYPHAEQFPSGGFHPGVVVNPSTHDAEKQLTVEQALLAEHGILPAMKVEKWAQLPEHMLGENIPSNFDLLTVPAQLPVAQPNGVVADDFRSDGRPIASVQWWGSYFDPQDEPFRSEDGQYHLSVEDVFVVSFFSDIPATPTMGSRPGDLLGTYTLPKEKVWVQPTDQIGWDLHRLWQYQINLEDAHLEHASPLATQEAFNEIEDDIYWISVAAATAPAPTANVEVVTLTGDVDVYKLNGAAGADPGGDEGAAPSRFSGTNGTDGIRGQIQNAIDSGDPNLNSNTHPDTLIQENETPNPAQNDNYRLSVRGEFVVDNRNGIPGETVDLTFILRTDDGSQLRIIGQDFTGTAGDTRTFLEDIDGDASLTADFFTGITNALGHISLVEGTTYQFESYMFEGGGGSRFELQAALGTHTAFNAFFFVIDDIVLPSTPPLVTLTGDVDVYKLNGAAGADPGGDEGAAPSRFSGTNGTDGIRGQIQDAIDSGDPDLNSNTHPDTFIEESETPNPAQNDNYRLSVRGEFVVDNENGIPGETVDLTFILRTDDGSQLRIVGQDFTGTAGRSLTFLEDIDGDLALTADFHSANSNALGHISLVEGTTYQFESYMFEGGAVSRFELQAALGTHTAFNPEVFSVISRRPDHFWGWHTSPDQFNDSAVTGNLLMPGRDWVYTDWTEIVTQHNSLQDMAFKLYVGESPDADLSITKSDSPDSVVAGTSLTYTITVSNAGPGDAQDVVVTDTLPTGVSNAVTNGCVEDLGGGVPTCTLGTIPAGSSAFYTITVDVDADTLGTITNTASVASSTTDPISANDSISEDTLVIAEADLSTTKTDALDVLTGIVTYTVTVNNTGPSDAQNVQVTDNLPAGLSFNSTAGCAEDPNGVPTCTLGTIIAGNSAQYTIMATATGSHITVTNTATATSTTTDPDSGNNSGSVTTDVKPQDPGFAYVDANKDGVFFAAEGDILLAAGEVADGRFDTDKEEGGYSPVIQGAGLVITASSGPIIADEVDFRSDGDLKIDTNLTATDDDVELTSRSGSVLLDDPTITAPDEIEIKAALDILSTDDVIVATGPKSEVELRAGRDIMLFVREVELRAGENITVNDSGTPLPGSLTASDPARGEVELRAGLDIDVGGAAIDAGDELQLIAGRDIFFVDAIMSALGNSRSEIELRADGDILAAGAELRASDEVELRSDGGSISADSATMEALGNSNGEVQLIAAGDINVAAASLIASRDVELRSRGGSILASAATMSALSNSRGEVELRADAGDINVDMAELFAADEVQLIADGSILASGTTMDATGNSKAEIELRAAGNILLIGSTLRANDEIDVRSSSGGIDATDAVMEALGNSKAEIELRAAGNISVVRATLSASDEIEVRSTGGSIDATDSTFTADEVELRAAIDIILTGWTVITSDLELRAGGTIFGP
jgi:uncharacterized repeat protein (TIGR01451 family)